MLHFSSYYKYPYLFLTNMKTINKNEGDKMKTNWREIQRKTKEESEAEDCMIPRRERGF